MTKGKRCLKKRQDILRKGRHSTKCKTLDERHKMFDERKRRSTKGKKVRPKQDVRRKARLSTKGNISSAKGKTRSTKGKTFDESQAVRRKARHSTKDKAFEQKGKIRSFDKRRKTFDKRQGVPTKGKTFPWGWFSARHRTTSSE